MQQGISIFIREIVLHLLFQWKNKLTSVRINESISELSIKSMRNKPNEQSKQNEAELPPIVNTISVNIIRLVTRDYNSEKPQNISKMYDFLIF